MHRRGRILRDTNGGSGLLTVEGIQYTFLLEGMWKSDVPPRIGMSVDVVFNPQGTPEEVHAVSEGQIAREQAEQALAAARRHSGALASNVKQRFALPTLIAEGLMLVSFFLLPNFRFGNGFAERALSGWDTLGLNMATMSDNDHGMLSILAVVFLLAPLVVPFVHRQGSKWLYAAPFAFIVLAFFTTYTQVQSASHQASQALADVFGREATRQFGNGTANLFSAGPGAYLVVLCSLYLLTRASKASWPIPDSQTL